MQITITARHFDIAEAHKNHAEHEIKRLRRYFDQIINADLTLIHEKYRYTAELQLHIDGATLVSRVEESEIYSAIDQAVEKMRRQLQKHKEKLQDHRVKRSE